MKHVITGLLWSPFALFFVMIVITPVGGWNPANPSYSPYYKLFFGISCYGTIITAILGYNRMIRRERKEFNERENNIRYN